MKTEELIHALAADPLLHDRSVGRTVLLALIPSLLVAAALFMIFLGPRHNLAQAIETLRFPFKFVVTASLAAAALAVVVRLSTPGADISGPSKWLWVAPALLAAAVMLELVSVPKADWGARLVGQNWKFCLIFIPLLSLAPLAGLIVALRHGASTAPRLSGLVAGLAAGGLGATLYAAHCPDDSPLFLATWYVIGIAVMALLGTFAGSRWLKW